MTVTTIWISLTFSSSPVHSGLLRSPGGHPAIWVATGRSGGVSEPPFNSLNLARHVGDDPMCVQTNLDRVAAEVGARRWAVLDAVHGADVAVVSSPDLGASLDTGVVTGVVTGVDALVTSEPGLALIALGADCVTVALAAGSSVAVVHAGWTGLVLGAVPAAVVALREESESDGVVAVVGPAICGQCYPVPRERAERVRRECAVADAALVVAANGQPGIDVTAGVLAQLDDCGVTVVWRDSRCTAEDPNLFSYRRDGRTGRQGIAICLATDPLAQG